MILINNDIMYAPVSATCKLGSETCHLAELAANIYCIQQLLFVVKRLRNEFDFEENKNRRQLHWQERILQEKDKRLGSR